VKCWASKGNGSNSKTSKRAPRPQDGGHKRGAGSDSGRERVPVAAAPRPRVPALQRRGLQSGHTFPTGVPFQAASTHFQDQNLPPQHRRKRADLPPTGGSGELESHDPA